MMRGDIVPMLQDVEFSKATKRQLEEYIAEAFRSYAIDRSKPVPVKAMKSIFQKIIDFLKALFTGVTIQDTANGITEIKPLTDMFNALYVGDINNYTAAVENVSFSVANAGMLSLADINEERNHTDSKLIKESIDGIISKLIQERSKENANWTVRGLTVNSNKINLYKEAKRRIFSRYVELLKIKQDANQELTPEEIKIVEKNVPLLKGKPVPVPTATTDDIQVLNQNIDLLNWTIVNFGNDQEIADAVNNFGQKDVGKGVVGYHLINSEFNDLLRLSAAPEEADIDNLDGKAIATTERYGDRGPNAVDPFEEADNQVVYLVKSLLKQDAEGNYELNHLGFPTLVDFTIAKNSLERKLTGVPSVEGLFNRINKNAKTDILYKQLASRLGVPGAGNTEQDKLWFKFTRTFSRPKQFLVAHIIEANRNEDGTVALLYKTGRASSDFYKVRSTWQSEFKQQPASNPYILQTSENVNYLNLPRIVKDFLVENVATDKNKKQYTSYNIKGSKSNIINFLNAIGLYVTPTEATLNDIEQYTTTFKYLANAIGELNNKNTIEEGGIQITNPLEDLSKPSSGFQKVVNAAGETSYNVTKITSQNSIINILAKIEANNSDKYSSTSRLNSEGEKQSEISKQSSVSKKIYALQQATNVNDFSNAESYFAYMSFLSGLNNPMAKASVFMNSLFSKVDGSRTGVGIDVVNLSGTTLMSISGTNTEENGASHASMGMLEKFITDFNMLLTTGIVAHPTTGGKSTHYSTKLTSINTYPGKVQNHLFIDSAEFIANEQGNYSGSEKAFGIILPYIQAELERMIKYNTDKAIYDKYKGFSDEVMNDFAMFDRVLSNETKAALKSDKVTAELKKGIYPHNPTSEQLAVYNANKNTKLADVISDSLKDKIRSELKQYFDALNLEHKSSLMDKFGFISPEIRNEINNTMKGEKLNMTLQSSVNKLNDAALRSFTYNSWLNNVEVTFLHNGELTTYNHTKDEATKRYPLFQSAGDMFPTDLTAQAMVNKLGTPLTKSVTGFDNAFDGTMNSGIIKDRELKRSHVYSNLHDLFKKNFEKLGLKGEELTEAMYGRDKSGKLGSYEKPFGGAMKAYAFPTVTDGQGYITLDAYRQLKNLEGKWSDTQEALYKRIVAKEPITENDAAEFFPVYKLQYAGNLKTDLGLLPITSGHKFALFPLIPGLGFSALDDLHEAMMKQGLHYVTYESGSKLQSITNNDSKEADSAFNPETQEFNGDVVFTKNTIFVDYLKDQTDVNTQFKGKSTMSTQLRTLLSTGLIENGIPVDFKGGLEAWEAMSEAEQMKVSPFYNLVRSYEKRVSKLVNLKKAELISKLPGWSKDADGNYSGPQSSIIDFVTKELKEEGLTEHELSYIEMDGKGDLLRDLSGSPIADTLEKKLMSIINRKVLRQMVTGEPFVEVSAANTTSLKFKGTKVDAARAKYGDNGLLAFYTPDVNGEKKTIACQVKIAMQGSFQNLFKLNDNEGNKIAQYDIINDTRVLNFKASLDKLNSLITNEEWLAKDDNRKKIRLTGVRIPVQGLNSMEYAEVAEFLPPSAGNIIILPEEIVAKSGTDFDVDKLTTYMPTIGKNGAWLYDKYTSREELDEELAGVETQLKVLLESKIGKEGSVKELLKDYKSDKKDKGLSIVALKLKRDALKAENSANINEIKSFLKEKNFTNKVYGGLEEILRSSDETKIANIIKGFVNIPPPIAGLAKAYNSIRENSAQLQEIKDALKEGYDDQTEYLKENKEINDLYAKYDELRDHKKNFIKAVENSLINDIVSILELPENAVRLLTANDTHRVKPYADEMESYVKDVDFKKSRIEGRGVAKGISPTNLLEYGFNLKKHEDNFVSKEALGIAALGNKGNSVYNSAGAFIPSEVNFRTKEDGMDVEQMVPTKLYFDTNKLTVDGKEVISLSHLYSKDGNEIAEIISQLMNGYVDSEKDAWIAYVQGNKEVTPVILFLLETGMPFKDIVYFVNNPLIREYVQKLKNNRGILAKLKDPTNDPVFAKPNAKKYVWNTLLKKRGKMPDMVQTATFLKDTYGDTNFTTDKLQKIAKTSISDILSKRDEDFLVNTHKDAVNGFLHYLYIEELARNFDEPRNKTNFDTNKSATLFDVFSKQTLVDELMESTKMPLKIIKYIVNTGPTSAFRTTELAQDLFGPLFPLRNDDVLNNYLFNTIKDFAKMGVVKRDTGFDKETFPGKFKNALMNYLFVNNLKSFNLGTSPFYKGMPISYINTGTEAISIKNDTIQINENLLKREFKSEVFVKDAKGKNSYAERGLATLNPNVFYKSESLGSKTLGAKAYYDFVVEREYLRSLESQAEFMQTYAFKSRFDKIMTEGFYKQRAEESSDEFETRISKLIYEEHLRNQALENTFNFNTMFFNGQQAGLASYATTLMSLINKYPNLEKKFSVLQQLSASYYVDPLVKNPNGVNNFSKNLVNIALKDAGDLTSDSTSQYANDLAILADRSKNKINIDSPEAREDNAKLSEMFAKFPTYVFLQGGMNKNQFAFPSIFPADSAQSRIMNDAINKAKIDKDLLDVVFDLFIKNNKISTKKINQRKAAINYQSLTSVKQLRDVAEAQKKESIITQNDEFDRLTSTSIEGVYTLDNTDITINQMNNLSDVYLGKARFVTEDGSFPDTALRLNYNSKDEIDESIQEMVDTLGTGIALVFNESGYGQGLDKELQNYLTEQLLAKVGVVNTPLPAIKIAGSKVISNEDITSFTQYLSKSNGIKPKEFFTAKTTFKEFFNPATGKREKAPQSTKWILNAEGYYDLVDKEEGEIYITNVNLATGIQMVNKPIQSQPSAKNEETLRSEAMRSQQVQLEKEMFEGETFGTEVEQKILKHGGFKTNSESYKRFGDWNNIQGNKKMVLAYFKNNALSLDQIAQEIDVEPQDLVDFMHNYPSGIGTKNSKSTDTFYGAHNPALKNVTPQPAAKVISGTDATINVYSTDENGFKELSNFAHRPFSVNIGSYTKKYKFNTVEGAFQAAKLGSTNSYIETKKLTPEQDIIFKKLQTATGKEAKAIGRSIKDLNRETWDARSSFIMKQLLTQSFKENPKALELLLRTGTAKLTHVGGRADKWTSEFPKLLMEVRATLPLMAAHHGFSGQADGSDTEWIRTGDDFSVGDFTEFTPDDLVGLSPEWQQKIEAGYQKAVQDLGRQPIPFDWTNISKRENYSGGLVRRDYLQALYGDAVYAISDVILPGEKGKAVPNKKLGKSIRYENRLNKPIVDGGTGYAVQMAINMGKPAYVFHQGTNADNATKTGWYKITNTEVTPVETPILTPKFAGIGTRQINDAGKQAIRDVYQKTFTNLADTVDPFKC
jgi:predicted NAD-dependent protein-ADP-ribosyltransferase YbiA (DUF1768 family)